jgi:ketosteroid isomerase-like protein
VNELTAANVTELFDRFGTAYSAKDVDAVMQLISTDPDTVMVGTGADEVRIGPDEIRRQVEQDVGQADELSLTLGTTRVSVRGEVAWAFAEPVVEVTAGGEHVRMPMRLTAVVTAEADRLVIRSAHVSVAFAEQEAGQSFADAGGG